MKTKYTKKQITEAIAYWKKQLKKMNESEDRNENSTNVINKVKRDFDYLVSFAQTGYQNGDIYYCITTKNELENAIRDYLDDVVSDNEEYKVDDEGNIDDYGDKKDVDRIVKNIMKNPNNVNAYTDDHYYSHFTSIGTGPEEWVTVDVNPITNVDDDKLLSILNGDYSYIFVNNTRRYSK